MARSYYNKIYKVGTSNVPDPGVQVALYTRETDQKVAQFVTNSSGEYAFYDVTPGDYRVKIFGSSHTPNEFFDIQISGDAVQIEDLIFIQTPTLSVSEVGDGFYDASGNQYSRGQFVINNIKAQKGALSQILVYWKPSHENSYRNNFTFSLSSSSPELSNSGDTATFYANLPMYERNSSKFHFKAQFLNSINEHATIDEDILEVFDLGPENNGQEFNGVADINEYVEVTGAQYLNTPLSETLVKIEWDDWKGITRSEFSSSYPAGYIATNNAFGTNQNLTWDQLQGISSYGVFQFLANVSGLNPDYERPGLNTGESEPNGEWTFVGDFASNSIEINTPSISGRKVGYWIGARWETTSSSAK